MIPDYEKYQKLWDTMEFTNEPLTKKTAVRVYSFKDRYEKVVAGSIIPWEVIGCFHYREGDCDFNTHLHNGDSLQHRTVNVPMHRPLEGEPPFTWEESAHDAIFSLKGLDKVLSWSLPEILYQFEKYNGLGYLRYHPTVLSPYLWSKTNHYSVGKYEGDGDFNSILVDKQIGCAPLYRYLTDATLGIAPINGYLP